ncbi:hypothetical protein [Agromyces sp. NPDC049794]|uniref:hypothetical protein n=1 Tax=unclassified Agromyces TaxID=2639701 RepID=UPI003411C771
MPGELTHKANVYFAYQIVEDGFPTAYWVTGFAENVRAGRFDHTSTCTISLGKPGDGGVTAAFSPYTCKMVGENLSGRGDWQVTFKVGVHDYTKVEGLEAQDPITRGCTAAGARCAYVMTSRQGYAGDRQLVGRLNNGGDETDGEMRITWIETRSDKNSIDTSVTREGEGGVSFLWVETFKVSFKIAYGHEWAFDKTRKWEYSTSVPPHTTAYFYLSPVSVSPRRVRWKHPHVE